MNKYKFVKVNDDVKTDPENGKDFLDDNEYVDLILENWDKVNLNSKNNCIIEIDEVNENTKDKILQDCVIIKKYCKTYKDIFESDEEDSEHTFSIEIEIYTDSIKKEFVEKYCDIKIGNIDIIGNSTDIYFELIFDPTKMFDESLLVNTDEMIIDARITLNNGD